MKQKIKLKGKIFKLIKHPKYRFLIPRYVSKDGVIITPYETEVKIHRPKERNKSAFVRMGGKKNGITLTVGQLILIAWERNPKDGEIAVHKEGNEDKLSNLFWGSRKDQAKIAMRNPKHYERVSNLYKSQKRKKKISEDTQKLIRQLNRDKVPMKAIANMVGVSISSAYKYL